jgi:hypothetical protein
MGLDISIHTKGYKAASEEEAALWEAMADDDSESPKVDYPQDEPNGASLLHPDNICTPSYLRSSYNAGGFNQAVPRFLKDEDTSLYGIFEPLLGEEEDYWIEVTDPGKVLLVQQRARDVHARLRALTAPLTVIDLASYGKRMTDIEAIEWVESELAKDMGPFGDAAYTSAQGYINPVGIKVYGVTQGTRGPLLVIRAEDENGPWSKSYADSAEIVAEEFCQTLLDIIERDGVAYMSWSG